MDLKKIDELLEKYWEAETSPEEEEALRNYFSQHEPPERLRNVAALFRQYQADRQFKTLDAAFDEEVLGRLSEPKASFRWRSWMSIAATLTILLLSFWLMKQYQLPEAPQETVAEETPADIEDTYEDPQEAYEQTRKALLLVSSLMNEGTQHLEKLETFNEAQKTIKSEKQ